MIEQGCVILPVVPVLQGDADQGLLPSFRAGDQGAASGVGVPGFHTYTPLIAPKQLVVVGQGPTGHMGRAGGDKSLQAFVFQDLLGQQGHIIGGRIMVFVIQPVGIYKVSILHPQAVRPLVHPVHKGLYRPGAAPGNGQGGVVAGGQQQAIEQLLQCQLLSYPEVH